MTDSSQNEYLSLITSIYEALNSSDAIALGNFFAEDAALYSLNDAVPPLEGKQSIIDFFQDFFEKAATSKFELLSAPQALGSMVMFHHIDSFELDGMKRDDKYVSVLLIVDGTVKKWLGYMEAT